MPAESEAQRRYLNWRFGHGWVKQHHFDNKGPLPPRVRAAGGYVVPSGWTQFWPGGGHFEGPPQVAAGSNLLGGYNWQDYQAGGSAPYIGIEAPRNSGYHLGQLINIPGYDKPGMIIDWKQKGYGGLGLLIKGAYNKAGNWIGNMAGSGRGLRNRVAGFLGAGGQGPWKGWSPEEISRWHNAPGYQQVTDPSTGNPYFGMSPPGGGAFGNTILNTNWVYVPGVGNVPMALQANPQASLNPFDYFGQNYGTGKPTQNVVGAVVGGVANLFIPGLGLIAGPAAKAVVRAFQQGGLPAAQQMAQQKAGRVSVSTGPLENTQFFSNPQRPTGAGGVGIFGGLPQGFQETNRFGYGAPSFLGPGGGFNVDRTSPGWFNNAPGTGPGFTQPMGSGGSYFQDIYNPHGWQPLPGATFNLGASGGSIEGIGGKMMWHAAQPSFGGLTLAQVAKKTPWLLPGLKNMGFGYSGVSGSPAQKIGAGPIGTSRINQMRRGGIVPLLPPRRRLKSYGTDTTPIAAKPGEMFLTNKQQTAVMPVPGREHLLKPDQLRALMMKRSRIPLPRTLS